MHTFMNFVPSAEVAALLNMLLNIYEQRESMQGDGRGDGRGDGKTGVLRRQSIKVKLDARSAPAYFSQIDPAPREIVNVQMQRLESVGVVRLEWLHGERGHLLAAAVLEASRIEDVYALLGRTSLAAKRCWLTEYLLVERARLLHHVSDDPVDAPRDWRSRALSNVIQRIRDGKSPSPFSIENAELNTDICTALCAVSDVVEEMPYRVFSVRTFNDSKRFEKISSRLATLAKHGNPSWRTFTREEVLRELNLVANPTHLLLCGKWEFVDAVGELITLGAFAPSVGIPAAQVAHLQEMRVRATRLICVENLTSFHELARWRQSNGMDEIAVVCLMGNPSPACRALLRSAMRNAPLFVWADIDYGGFNILAQIRGQVDVRAQPLWMDAATFDRCARQAKPFTGRDEKLLTRLMQQPLLADVQPAIAHLLRHRLKLEQEAVAVRDMPAIVTTQAQISISRETHYSLPRRGRE